MNTAATAPARLETNTSFHHFIRIVGAELRRAIELSAVPYIIMGSRPY